MAEALIKGVIDSDLLPPTSITASDVDSVRLSHLNNVYGIKTTASNDEAVSSSDIIIFAVKPQHIDEVVTSLDKTAISYKLAVSIAAGVTTGRLERLFKGGVKLVRVMPNSPALVGAGISALYFSDNINSEDKDDVTGIFSSVGETIEIDESLMDQVTAISGSGPAYFFYFVRALVSAAIGIGLDPDVSAKLVLSTMEGSSKMLSFTEKGPTGLIEMVASKGGTTEAALDLFDQEEISDIITRGVEAALKRAAELDAS